MDLIEEIELAKRLPKPAEARAIRLQAGVPITRLARELDVHRVSVARWEAGSRKPRGQLLLRYASLLDQLRKAAA
ncbi:helix-turn-helix transcriptional regulator [Amycolatopsis mongoliensis]|uniref:Helix-turn-helix transcriptional regulator n=1 Tax=Amycolatopsis mongoliensis TaxID=715475 RepID=A0A9Y2JJS4_9PSEU|nr:helix-turn-helix transcriptional regulator [Amycolatopsis sp. 4-36]WIX99332.1 helix-turn-helix transcriptional regulator [Amycolatopsis sp. 4-36]